jgi:hypothetical protein
MPRPRGNKKGTQTATLNKRYKKALEKERQKAVDKKRGQEKDDDKLFSPIVKFILIYELIVVVSVFMVRNMQATAYDRAVDQYRKISEDDIYSSILEDNYKVITFEEVVMDPEIQLFPSLFARINVEDEFGKAQVICPRKEGAVFFGRLASKVKVRLFRNEDGGFLCYPPHEMITQIKPDTVAELVVANQMLVVNVIKKFLK